MADPTWLRDHLDDSNLVIVDLDAEAGYLRGHIPGAVFLDNNYERNPETGWVDTMPPERFAAVCQGLGIGDDTLVVAYDNNMSLQAARFWWTLSYNGHTNVKVLDGGWRGWVAGGGAIAFDRAAPRAGSRLYATYRRIPDRGIRGMCRPVAASAGPTRRTRSFGTHALRENTPAPSTGPTNVPATSRGPLTWTGWT